MSDYQRVLETLKDRLDIVDLVSERVPLKKRGRNFVGLCPFHAEKTPSFTVNPEKQMFYCFGCGAGGDAITFWMKIENLDFTDAVKDLADRLGIELPKKRDRGSSKWETYHAINQAVKAYFHENLVTSERGRAALIYLKGRGLSLETIRGFELGFAPASYGLEEVFGARGLSLEDAVPIGLVKQTETGTVVPVFRNRIIFPIVDDRGRTVGFGGRVMGDRLPKYLNSPDSMIFQKGRLFYGEAQTRREIARQRTAVLVEGYLDLLALYQLGIRNGIAALGTAFTDAHALRLKRWADRVILLFDGDEAGSRAATRALEKLTLAGLECRQGVLPPGKDPGDYLTPPDGEGLKAVIDNAEDAILFRFRQGAQKKEGEDIRDQERRIKEGLRFLGVIPDPVRRSLYVEKAEAILGLKKDIIYNTIKYSERNGILKKHGTVPRKGDDPSRGGIRRSLLSGSFRENPEEVVLTSVIQCPELADNLEEGDIESLFREEVFQSLVRKVLDAIRAGEEMEGVAFLGRLNEKEKAIFSRLMVKGVPMSSGQARKAFSDGLNGLYRRRYKAELEALDRQMREREKSGDFTETVTLLKRREAIKKSYQQVLRSNFKSR